MIASAKLLDEACKTGKNADVQERVRLVRRVRVDNKNQLAQLRMNSIDLDGGRTNGSRDLIKQI